MFTGIIEKSVHVIGVADGPAFKRLTLATTWNDVKDGESVAVNGVCLTVAEQKPGKLGFDVVQETLSLTNLGLLRAGDEVHVERSLRAGDRFDGHFVQGHVDGTAKLLSLNSIDGDWRLAAECPAHLAAFIIPKGSVALDGVSLTVAAFCGHTIEVALIPTTLRLTRFARMPAGWPINLECDMMVKSVVATVRNVRSEARTWENSNIEHRTSNVEHRMEDQD